MAIPITRAEYERKFGVKAPNTSTSTPQVKQQEAKMPILTNEQGGVGTAAKDVAVGGVKSFVEGARGTAQLLQGAGKGILGAFGADTSQMGFRSLDNATPEGAQITEQLKAKSRGEQVGKVLGTAGEIAGGFVAAKGPQAIAKVKTAIQAKNEAKSLEGVLDAVTPRTKDLTPTEYEDLLRQNKISPKTASQPAKYILSDQEKANAIKYKHLLTKDPVKTSINIMDDIAKKDTEVGNFLRQNNGVFNSGELKNHILDKLSDISDITIPQQRIDKLKQTMTDGFINALQKNDMESLWKSRKAFDRSIEKVFSGSPTLQNQMKREFRNAIQDFIMERTPEGVYKGMMGDMRELFNLFETVSTKATKERAGNAIQAWMKNNPTKAKLIGWGLGGGLIGVTGNALIGN